MMRPLLHRLLVPLALLAAITLLAVAGARFAYAHGNPEIMVNPNPAPAGSTVTIEGQGFEEDVEVSLSLEGMSGTIALRTAMTDAEGAFHLELTLPNSATPGSYQVRAEGGDDSAVFEFRISQAAGQAEATPTHEDADGAQPPPERKPVVPARPAPEHETSIGFHRAGPADEVIGLAALTAVIAIAGGTLLLVRERGPSGA